MNYLGLGMVGRAGARFVSSCKDLYNDLNGANLTGAVDVVVVKQIDGSYKSTPFHVRFGKWGVLRTGDLQKEVEVEVNGEAVHNRMMLDENGSAFFIKPKHSLSVGETVHSSQTDQFVHRSHSLGSVPDSLVSLSKNAESLEPHLEEEPIVDPLTAAEDNFTSKDSSTDLENGINTAVKMMENGNECVVTGMTDNYEIEAQSVSTNKHNPKLKTLKLQHSTDAECDGSVFETPTSNLEDFQWLMQRNREEAIRGVSTDLDSGVLSDSALELLTGEEHPTRTFGILSDSEVDSRREEKSKGEVPTPMRTSDSSPRSQQSLDEVPSSSLWGAIRGIWSRKKRRRFSSIEEGLYLDDLESGTITDEEKAMFFPHRTKSNGEEDIPSDSSGLGISPPSTSPLSSSPQRFSHLRSTSNDEMDKIIDLLSNISISRCGLTDDITEESFAAAQISFDEFSKNPELLTSADVVVRVDGKYYNWSVAGPLIMSVLLYQRPLTDERQSELVKKHMSKNKSRQSLWRLWSNDTAAEKFGKVEEDPTPSEASSSSNAPSSTPSAIRSLPPKAKSEDHLLSSDDDEVPQQERTMSRVRQRSLRKKKFIFTNELTSKELSKWPLKLGKNDLVFSITTKYQGTAKASCSLYLWNYDDRIVVSDFDGTITRSDVAGQVLPLLGKDWTHYGVIELFSAIERNGYKFLYLSARAIGQSMYTKNYLRNTRRGECYLPDGPLLVTPFSLYKAFKKEVIERKPEEFKILCLQQIRTFFPDEYNPFHAGFGNKPSDAKSYLEVSIPSSRIFTVNPKGELKNELTWTFHSSYSGLMDFVDGQFPPIVAVVDKQCETAGEEPDSGTLGHSSLTCIPDEEFSSFLYWQHSLNTFDLIELPDI